MIFNFIEGNCVINSRLFRVIDICDGKKECEIKRGNNYEIEIILELYVLKLLKEFLECGSK